MGGAGGAGGSVSSGQPVPKAGSNKEQVAFRHSPNSLQTSSGEVSVMSTAMTSIIAQDSASLQKGLKNSENSLALKAPSCLKALIITHPAHTSPGFTQCVPVIQEEARSRNMFPRLGK